MNYYEIMEDLSHFNIDKIDIPKSDIIEYRVISFWDGKVKHPYKVQAYIGKDKFLGDNTHPTEIVYDIKGRIEKITYKRNGMLHRDDDKPAIIRYVSTSERVYSLEYYRNGHIHRNNDKPALIFISEYRKHLIVRYYLQGKLRRRDKYKPNVVDYCTEKGELKTIEKYTINGKLLTGAKLEHFLLEKESFIRKKKIDHILNIKKDNV